MARIMGRIAEWPGWNKAAAIVTTIAALAALWFTSKSLLATNNQYELSQQVAMSDRFQKATEQLSSDKLDVRLSGIYLLERLAKDSAADHPTVFALLSAYLRTHTSAAQCPVESPTVTPAADVQAVLTVIGRRAVELEAVVDRPDLSRTCLAGARMRDSNFAGVNFRETNLAYVDLNSSNLERAQLQFAQLTHAKAFRANLSKASLAVANLTGTDFMNTDLTDAFMCDANLTAARFEYVNLTEACLANTNMHSTTISVADLTGASCVHTDLTLAHLDGSNLSNVDLTGANLAGAYLFEVNLTDVNWSGVVYDSATRWPAGFTPPR
ncbi:pentapeptide repeat-containing protein [Nocardia sp. NPDC057030]|uniref:pentapeptide repeat-containing protein n=1 Tax=unclassified Nocardia TaxID=2637762 RepID=UPI00362FE1BC